MAEIPLSQAADQIAAGTFMPTVEQPMIGPDGTAQIVQPAGVKQALADGFKLVDHATAQHVADVQEAGEHPIKAFGVGLAKGVVPFAPSIIQAAGGPTLEEQRNLAEGNPLATPAGELTGNVGQAVIGGLLTGGASDVAEGASLGSKVFDAADMAKQAAIFAGQGASNEINEQDLGDHGYNGEAVVSQAGLGALLGAASSPAFALAKEVLPNPITAAGNAIAKASDALTGALGRTAGEGGEAAARSIGELGAAEAQNRIATDIASGLQDTVDKSFDQMSAIHEDLKPAQVRALSEQDAYGTTDPVAQIERTIANDPNESSYLVAPNGRVLSKIGGANHVALDPAELKDLEQGTILTHNHPGGSSLSSDDVSIASVIPGVHEVRAVSRGMDGVVRVHSISPEGPAWPHPISINTAFDDQIGEMGTALYRLPIDQRANAVWEKIATKLGLKYTTSELEPGLVGHTVGKTATAINAFRTNGIDPTLSRLTALADDGRISKPLVSEVETAVRDWNEATSKATTMLDYQAANHQLGRTLDDNVMKYAKDLTPGVAPVVRDVEQNIRTPLRQMLRDPEIMGPRLASANGALTDAEHALFQSTEALYRGLGFTDLLADGRPADKARISASRVLTNLRNSEKLGQQQNNAVIQRFLADAKNLNDVTAQVAKDGGHTTDTEQIQNLLRDQATKQAQGQATAKLSGSGTLNGGMGYSVGGFGPEVAAGLLGHAASMATGVPGLGAAAGLATRGVRLVKHPASTLEMLGKIKALADKHTADIAKAASSFFTGTGRVVAPVVAGNALRAGKDYGDHDSDTEARMAEVRTLSSNPGLLSNTLMRNTTALADGAPVTALSVQTNTQTRLGVVASTLPNPGPQGMIRTKYPQSIDATQKFELCLNVMSHPAKAIQAAMVDENLTSDMVDWGDRGAPKTMAAIRQAFQSEMVDRYDHDYTLGQKQMLSVLFKAPVTPDVAPAQVAFLQATFAPPAPTPPPGGTGKPSLTGLAKLNPGNAIATPTQSRQMERA